MSTDAVTFLDFFNAYGELMSTLIVAVFNHNIARFLRAENDGGVIEVATMICPEARLPEHELHSDRPSRTHDSFGARHAHELHMTAREKFSKDFARKIADWLDVARVDHLYTRLVLVAPPDMLGVVRHSLSRQCCKMLVEECTKNVAHMDVARIVEALPHTLKAMTTGNSPL